MRSRIVSVFASALLALVGIMIVPAAPAQAAKCLVTQTCITTFYQESAHVRVVGQRIFDCGVYSEWGVTSPYVSHVVQGCQL